MVDRFYALHLDFTCSLPHSCISSISLLLSFRILQFGDSVNVLAQFAAIMVPTLATQRSFLANVMLLKYGISGKEKKGSKSPIGTAHNDLKLYVPFELSNIVRGQKYGEERLNTTRTLLEFARVSPATCKQKSMR